MELDAAQVAESLLRLVDAQRDAAAGDPLAQATGVELALRAAQVLAADRLQTVRERYAATNQALLHVPDAQVAVDRDALADEADTVRFLDVLDLASAEELPCIAPRLHRGWQDRVESCREARRISQEVFGFALGEGERSELLAALAIANRVFRVPPPVALDPGQIAAVWPPLLAFIERLAPDSPCARLARTLGGG